jgi:hypothetical protein
MKIKYEVEYSVMFQNKDLQTFGNIWDVTTDLDEDLAVEFVLKLAEKQALEDSLEVVAMARAQKKTYYNEVDGKYAVTYLTPFEHVDIYAKEIHPPRRFRDIANAE